MKKLPIILISIFLFIFLGLYLAYTVGLPYIVSNNKTIEFTKNYLDKNFSVSTEIVNPKLSTSNGIVFSIDSLILKDKNQIIILKAEDFSTKFYLKDLLRKKIEPKYLYAKTIYADSTLLMKAFIPENQEQQSGQVDFKISVFKTDYDIKNVKITYDLYNRKDIVFELNNLKTNEGKYSFKSILNICNYLVKTESKENIFYKNKKLFFDNFLITHNTGRIVINGFSEDLLAKSNFDYDLKIKADKFYLDDLKISGLKKLKGCFLADIVLKPNDFNGCLKIKNAYLKEEMTDISLAAPLIDVDIDKDKIKLNKINGYFNHPDNKFDVELTLKDYLNKKISYDGVANISFSPGFAKYFLSKKLGCPVEISGDPNSKIIFKGVPKKAEFTFLYRMLPGEDFTLDGRGLGMNDKERVAAMLVDVTPTKMFLKSLDYFITFIDEKGKEHRISIITLKGDWNITKEGLILDNVGFKINKFIPAEFFNAITKQTTFRKGLIKGELKIDNRGTIPKIKGELTLEKVRIPAEKMFIKDMNFTADDNFIKIKADGRYKKSKFEINGKLINRLVFPLVVKNMDLTIDDIDVDKMLANLNLTEEQKTDTPDEEGNTGDNVEAFDIGNIIVENSNLIIKKGIYKDLDFSDLVATATLDKTSFFDLKSNKFNVADGHSGLKFYGNLKENIFNLKLGAKDVNAQKIASTFLGLKDDISGSSSGLIDVSIDNTTGYISGKIGFYIKKGKMFLLGFSEYMMRAVNILRNPLNLSLNNIFGLFKSNEGDFNYVSGFIILKDNQVTDMQIKTQSDTIATYITGNYDLNNFDADLNIFAKFAKNTKTVLGGFGDFSFDKVGAYIPLESTTEYTLYKEFIQSIPDIDAKEKNTSIYIIKVDGDVGSGNFLSSVKKIK